VGTIASFDPDTGILVIDPTTGDPVSGTVVDRTRIKCENEVGDDDPGDDVGDDNGDDGTGHDVGDDHGGDGSGHGGPGHGRRHDHGNPGNCSTGDLAVGAEVQEAELDLTGSGLVYEEIELR
jgi:hypothetical protein